MKTAPLCTLSLLPRVVFLLPLNSCQRWVSGALWSLPSKAKWKGSICFQSPPKAHWVKCLQTVWMAGEASHKRLVDEWNMECMRSILPVIRSETTFFLKEEKYCIICQIWISLEKVQEEGRFSNHASKHWERPFRHYWDFWRGEEKNTYYFILIFFLNIIIY